MILLEATNYHGRRGKHLEKIVFDDRGVAKNSQIFKKILK